MKKNIETISSETMSALVRYDWPGNIRELQNVVERSVIVSGGSVLKVPFADLNPRTTTPSDVGDATPDAERLGIRSVLQQVERKEILSALEHTNWVIAGPHGAAARLGLNRSTLQLRMRKLGISRYTTDL
jgi:formate hydrogenlyase transcriptional activator